MTVFPGFGGQSFMPEVLDKVRQVRAAVDAAGRWRSTSRLTVASTSTAPRAAEAGANVFVAGSAIFGHERPWDAAEEIRGAIARTGPLRRMRACASARA